MTLPAAAQPTQTSTPEALGEPERWGLSDAENVVKTLTPDWIGDMRAFVVEGDHWQAGRGWVGPAPAAGEAGRQLTLDLIEQGFVSRNVLAEAAERYTNGLVGFQPAWSLAPIEPMDEGEASEADQALIDEATDALIDWWDKRGIGMTLWHAVYQMTWSTRGPLRLFVSRRAFTASAAGVIPRQKSLADALGLILLDAPQMEQAAVYLDPDTHEETGVYLFKAEGEEQDAEVAFVKPDSRETVIRTITAGTEIVAAMGGVLPIHQLSRLRLLTQQAVEIQKAINLALSIIPKTLITAGFLERILINAKMPGEFIEDAQAPGGYRWRPGPPLEFGPATTNILSGIETTDDITGKKSITTPSVSYRPPIEPTGATNSRRDLYAAFLEEVDQAHILLAQEAAPSGRSRAEARADYRFSLQAGKVAVDRGGHWLFTAALGLAEYLMGAPGRFTSRLRVQFQSRLAVGPIDPTERTQNVEEWKAGLRSQSSVMMEAGIDDPEAELATIGEEAGAQLDLSRRRAEVVQVWLNTGASAEFAAAQAGLDDDETRQLVRDVFTNEEAARAATEEAARQEADERARENGSTPREPAGAEP